MSNNQETKTILKVNCPTCKIDVVWNNASTYRPFCSDRCQKIDLGAWASEEYSIAAEPTEEWSGDSNFTSDTNEHTIQ